MTRLDSLSYWARQWGIYFFYFFALGAVGILSVAAATRLTQKLVVVAAKSTDATLRPISRVERQIRERARQAVRVAPPPDDEVVALVRPAVHPAVMAAQLDRVETAVTSHGSSRLKETPITVVSCDAEHCTKARVRGWRRSAQVKTAAKISPAAGPNVVDGESDPASGYIQQVIAGSKGVRVAIAGSKQPKGMKSAKTKAASNIIVASTSSPPLQGAAAKAAALPGKLSLLPKTSPSDQRSTAVTGSPFKQRLRIADTPGEIVRVSLLGRS